jgi:hypothetical protein
MENLSIECYALHQVKALAIVFAGNLLAYNQVKVAEITTAIVCNLDFTLT